jgi:hypothetical protein
LFGACAGEALGWGWERGVADGCAVASEVDGVHHREGAADAESEAEEKSDDGTEGDVHAIDDGMNMFEGG